MNPKLKKIADAIVEMKRFSDEMGIQTNRSQGKFIDGLDAVEVSIVAAEVNRQLRQMKEETHANLKR
jgi:hypothetical protein